MMILREKLETFMTRVKFAKKPVNNSFSIVVDVCNEMMGHKKRSGWIKIKEICVVTLYVPK